MVAGGGHKRLQLNRTHHFTDLQVVVGGVRVLALDFLGEVPARQGHGVLALVVQGGVKLNGVERLVNKVHKGHNDLVLVVGDCVHMMEEKGLVSGNVESICLRDGDPLAEMEVEVIVILIRVGVEM
jgi:hypothetical protein